jgi:hypothetical protein
MDVVFMIETNTLSHRSPTDHGGQLQQVRPPHETLATASASG